MTITYLSHSGFLIEWETCYWLFDYYKGVIPSMKLEKKIFVFSSHKHGDHYNPIIFELLERYPEVEYVLSSDIKVNTKEFANLGVANTSLTSPKITSVKPSSEFTLFDKSNNKIDLRTLKSTDCGVAFLLRYQDKTIYHAGDLNLWVWKEGSKQFNNNMTASFNKKMNELKDLPIDIAFAPLDPRQEEWYYMGLECLLNTAKVQYVFPMHFWDQPTVIQQFKSEREYNREETQIMDVSEEGQRWTINS